MVTALLLYWDWEQVKCAAFLLQDAPAEAEVLYEGDVFYFDDSRKWKERYVVVRANYCLDCHDSLQVSLTTKPTVTVKYRTPCKLLLLCSFVRVFLRGFLRATSCCLRAAQFRPQRRRTWPWWTSVSLMTPVSKKSRFTKGTGHWGRVLISTHRASLHVVECSMYTCIQSNWVIWIFTSIQLFTNDRACEHVPGSCTADGVFQFYYFTTEEEKSI